MTNQPDTKSVVTVIDLRRTRFEDIAGEVFLPLQKYLLRRADRDDVDDLLSETLLVVWRRLEDVPADTPLAWCYGVARRVLANHRRADNRRLRLVRTLEAEPKHSIPDPDDGDPALEAALSTLGSDDRELVRLWAWEQLEPREIALVLDSTPNAVSLRLTRIKKKLADELGRQDRGGSGQIPGKHAQEM